MPSRQPVVIVLCGGTSRRLAGRDKTRESLGGTTVMDYLLDGLPTGWLVLCVGEEHATTRSVQWCRESPACGGPVAGIAAGLQYLKDLLRPEPCELSKHSDHSDHSDHSELSEHSAAEICVVVGGDMPFAAPAIPALVETLRTQPGLDAVLATDGGGRAQPLLAAYRCAVLRAALPRQPGGAQLMPVIDALVTGTLPSDSQITLDVDTPEALEKARHIVGA